MILTKDNIRIYAMQYYDNHTCLSEEEFDEDLKQLRTIRRMLSRYLNGEESNIRLLINNIIIFYNCFKHHAASKIIELHIDENHIPHFNSILKFLSLPMLSPIDCIDQDFLNTLENEFK